MSFPDSQSPFGPHGFDISSDGIQIIVWPQYPVVSNQGFDHDNMQFEQPHSLKRPREEENRSVNAVFAPQMMPCTTARINTGTNIFFKTRLCDRFKIGQCRNGEACKYAHGVEELRQPPPNWQELVNGREVDRGTGNWDDEQRIASKMKLCKRFSNGEVCPYGDKCNFLHEDLKRFKDDSLRIRESSAISIGAALDPVTGDGSGLNLADPTIGNAVSDAYRTNMRTEHWKTKPCNKFELNGFCSFGDKCGFAHGMAELKVCAGRAEGQTRSVGPFTTHMNPIVGAPNSLTSSNMNSAVLNTERTGMKDFSKLKGSKKINRIYGDWIDGLSLDSA